MPPVRNAAVTRTPVRAGVTRDRIGEAALLILDSGSDESALTMRSLGRALGVQAPSLYAHVSGIDDVVDLVHERINTSIDLSVLDAPDPLGGLRRFGHLYREGYGKHPVATTMIVTLLGAAASDALESGQVVSGVGGQYNFVAMAHALPDARLIMMLRATHDNKDGLKSSIVWNYGHVTIPRHLRDIIITEYGVAELRGQPDSEVIKRLIAVADSRFQDELVKQAKANGKLDAHYQVPERYRNNLPHMLEVKLRPWSEADLLPDFPFGTDLTTDELQIVRALKKLKHAANHPTELLSLALKSFWGGKEMPLPYQERLGLADAHSFRDTVLRRLLAGNL